MPAIAKIIPFVSPRLDRMAEHAKMSSEFEARMRQNEEASLRFMAWREANGLPVYVPGDDEFMEDAPSPVTGKVAELPRLTRGTESANKASIATSPASLLRRFIGWFK